MGCTASENESHSWGLLSKPQVFFLLGGPGSGKGTQAQNLVRDYKFKHLSTGDLLRAQQEKGGQLAAQIQKCIKQGILISSELVVRLMKKAVSAEGNRRYLIDGFPRNSQNLAQFEKQLRPHVIPKNLIYFDCPTEILIERMTKRGQTSGRADDNPESIKKRILTFESQTVPMVKQFENSGNCIRVNANQQKDKVYSDLQTMLTNAKIFPPLPAQVIFVLGGPGSGKGTQCSMLVKKYGLIHLSTGDLLREQIASKSALGKQIDSVIKQGKLVSSDLMVSMLNSRFERNNYGGRYLIDGFPRGQNNIDSWQKIINKWADVKAVLFFDCPDEQLKKRLLIRGKTSGRSDDNQESIVKRLKVFHQQTIPALKLYQSKGKLSRIDANQTVENVTIQVEQFLDSIGIYPRRTKQKKPKVVLILGPPGSGMSVQSDKICKQFGFKNISIGQLLRKEVKNNGRHSQLVSELMKSGKLVPSQLVVKLIKTQIQNDNNERYLLDGFPRCKQNIVRWDQQIGIELDITNMLFLDCSQAVANARLVERSKLGNRNDDTPESIRLRYDTYQKQTLPVIKKLFDQPYFSHKIDATKSVDQIYDQVKKALIKAGYNSL